MKESCRKCGHEELTVVSRNVFAHAVERISNLVKSEVAYVCPGCGQKTGQEQVLDMRVANPLGLLRRSSGVKGKVKRHSATLSAPRSDGRRWAFLQYPCIYRAGDNVLYPTFEGSLQDGTVIDRYGDPDLMLDFSERYFGLFKRIMPRSRLPANLAELMPALHLLVIAAELGLKAFLLRNGRTEFGHSLEQLFDELEAVQQEGVEQRFAELELNARLVRLEVEAPTVKGILRLYDNTYGGESKVFFDSRYFAEPTTTTFKRSSHLHGASLSKSHNPYPIFLPGIVTILIAAYRFFSGHERLRRLGANVGQGTRDPVDNNHGDWGLVPASLGLVVFTVPQSAGISAKGEDLAAFKRFTRDNPPAFRTDWMYGGGTHLFYADGGQDYSDGESVVDGVTCRVWRHDRLGMHARDLNLLADLLESAG
ncbi:MAG: hypothetical protein OXC69_09115, partial [Candidatus Tectomicrobia bacterium]|nr:hypothetical protein [Candidatus Tectomicrobia bacterium]